MEHFDDYIERNGFDKKPYQYEGVAWCLKNEVSLTNPHGVLGGIVADEMGLGKTITMLGLLCANPLRRTLIVLPTVILDQWVITIQKTMDPRLRYFVYYGRAKENLTPVFVSQFHIVLTTYQTVACEFQRPIRSVLFHISWDRIVYDEAHHLRNQDTVRSMSSRSLKSRVHWLVTGTPIQNSKRDFYSLCSLLGLPPSYYVDNENRKDIVHHFILKRKKKEVLDASALVPLVEDVQTLPWSNSYERDLATTIHSLLKFNQVSPSQPGVDAEPVVAVASAPPIPFPKVYEALNKRTLIAYTRAKQICVLPSLLDTFLKATIPRNEMLQNEAYAAMYSTSKMNLVVERLFQRKDNGNGKLVFCQYKGEIEHLKLHLSVKGFTSVAVLDGGTSAMDRTQILGMPNSVLILQIQTCSEGLNLQEFYNEVYFTSPHWNPCVEDQAVARCWRVGQKKPVYVFRFVMLTDGCITMDSHIAEAQGVKRDIASEIV